MKIIVQTPLKSEEIKLLLDGKEYDGVQFAFLEKRGIGLTFEVQGASAEAACRAAKQVIKEQDWGKVLYFSVAEG